MNTYKAAIITGSVAVVAVIVTIIILASGGSGSGLYVSSASGSVTVTDASGNTVNAEVDRALSKGDVLTVNDGAVCRLAYRSKKNRDDVNFAVIEPASQVFVTGEFNGKEDSELYLNSGAVLVSSLTDCPANIIVRTESSSYTTGGAVMRVAYIPLADVTVTQSASFSGNSEINLYDNMGSLVDREGFKLQSPSPEVLGEGRTATVISGNPPSFNSLNLPAELSEFSATTLRELFTVSTTATTPLAFSTEEIKAAYDAAPDDSAVPADVPVTEPDTAMPVNTEPVELLPPDTELLPQDTEPYVIPPDTDYVPEPVYTEPPATEAPRPTEPPVTTTAAPVITTETPAPTEAQPSAELIKVYIFVDEEIYVQEVEYGADASQPSVPEIPGKRFIGWDGSFANITEEREITAIFEDDAPAPAETTVPTETDPINNTDYEDPFTGTNAESFTVTVMINGQASVQTVPYGGTAIMPAVAVPGYDFLGWEGEYTNVTSDRTITAILIPSATTPADATVFNPFVDVTLPY